MKVIKDDGDALMIEGRPKLSISKVSHKTIETKSLPGGLTSPSSTSPKIVTQVKLPPSSSVQDKSATAADLYGFSEESSNEGSGGGPLLKPSLKRKASDSFGGPPGRSPSEGTNPAPSCRLKIKLPLQAGSSAAPAASSSAPSSSSVPTGPSNSLGSNGNKVPVPLGSGGKEREELAFAFAGKPTYSPSRVEPSTTTQGKGEEM